MEGSTRSLAAKAALLALVALTLIPAAASASAYSQAVLSDGPAAYWRVGEPSGSLATDQTANGNLAAYSGGATLGVPGALSGDSDTAVSFDGVDDALSAPDAPSLDLSSGATVEAWVKRAKTGWQVVAGKPGNGQSRFENYALWFDSSNFLRAFFGNGLAYASISSATPLDTNWHHVAATYDNATIRLYIDGALNASGAASVQLTPNTQPMNVGRDQFNSYYFGGRLDEVAVYPTALSAARISRHYEIGSGVDVAPPAVTISSAPAVSNSTPPLGGAAGAEATDLPGITVDVFNGSSATGTPVRTLNATANGGSWSTDVTPALPDGTYTARAKQVDAANNTGTATVTFRIDTAAPAVTITHPQNGRTTSDTTPAIGGSAGGDPGDADAVVARVYAGATATGMPVRTLNATRTDTTWGIDTTPALDEGTYTAVAQQADSAGNSGTSDAVTFTITSAQSPPQTPYKDAVLADGAVAYWRLGESSGTSAADESANANTATYTGGVALGQPGALAADQDTAASFDGVNDALSAPDAPSLDLSTGATIETWVKRAKSGWQVVVGKPGNGQSRFENYALWFDSSDYLRAFFGNGVTYSSISSSVPMDTNWHYVVATYDNATIRLYVDGTLNTTASGSIALTPNTQPMNVGRDQSSSYFFGGRLDEVAVYPTALTAARVGRHYELGTAVDTSGPALTLDDPSDGDSVADQRPTFSGTAGDETGDGDTVTVDVFAGSSTGGTPLRTVQATRDGDSWQVRLDTPLPEGDYTARASQSDAGGNTTTVTAGFTIDVTGPSVVLFQPAQGANVDDSTPVFSGEAGSAAGDSQTVRVRVYAGSSASGTPEQVLTATRSDNGWGIEATQPLAEGTYTARAEQSDTAGNLALSNTSTFTIIPPQPPAASPYKDAVMADSPRAYWRLGETSGTVAKDVSGNGNDGTYVNGVALGQPGRIMGDPDTSVNFDGVNDYMTVPNSSSLNITGAVTVEAWVKRAKSGWQVIAGKPGNGQSRLENYALWFDSGNFVRAFFGDGTNYVNVSSTAPLDTNWHKIAASYDNATVRLYIDGVQNATATSTVQLTPNTLPLLAGRESGNTFYMGGRLDELAVYASALPASRLLAHFSTGNGVDTTPPAVRLTTPAAGTSTVDHSPIFAGGAAITGTDSQTVTVNVYAGATATGTPLQTVSTTRAASGAWTAYASGDLPNGLYTAEAVQNDDAGNAGRSTSTFSIVDRPPVGLGAELAGAGDIGDCEGPGDDSTANVLDGFPNATVFTLGDNAYERGTPDEYANCYAPTWGRFKARTKPALGDHDYGDGADPTAAGYFGYFNPQLTALGASAADPNRGYYSFEAGTWHVVVLNPICGGVASGCSQSGQLAWLASDLAAHPVSCTLALVSSPRWSSGSVHGNNTLVQPYWAALNDGGVELMLSGDDHDYERFAPQDATGNFKANGLREIIVGTGGRSHYLFNAGGVVRPNSEVRNDTTYGVLRLVLRSGSYEWEFVPEAGRTFMDSGSDSCH
jgi:Concanavalin A-like lectin/glucanases superfamily/Bacterial Ig-like domain